MNRMAGGVMIGAGNGGSQAYPLMEACRSGGGPSTGIRTQGAAAAALVWMVTKAIV